MAAPTNLRAAVERDLTPTRPLDPPAVRTLWLVPLAIATVLAVPILHEFRPDVVELGWVRSWWLSALEAAAGLAIVALAFRESIPGRALATSTVVLTAAAGYVLPIVVVIATEETFVVGPRAGHWVGDGIICFRASASAALPALVAASVLVSRAFALRPRIAGALYGIGCGVIADAGLRLFCHYSAPTHILTAHLGAIAASMLAGMIAAPFLRSRGSA